MTPQTSPTYSHATSVANPIIVNTLERKYGKNNVVWPIVLIENERTIGYLYEKNNRSVLNTVEDHRPQSTSGLPNYFLDYSAKPRKTIPTVPFLEPFLAPQHQCSYDYIVDSPYSTVDLDYVWAQNAQWKGCELTTFWVEFVNREKAESLIKKLRRRPSWQGPEGPHALRKIVDSSEDLGIEYYMACVNTIGRVTNHIRTDGKAYWFPLSHCQIDRLAAGHAPVDATFDSFSAFLEWL